MRLPHFMNLRTWRKKADRGNAAIESAGLTIFAAFVIGSIAAFSPGNMVYDYTRDAVCLVAGDGCGGKSWIELDDTDPPIRRPVTTLGAGDIPEGSVDNEKNRKLGKELAGERGWKGKEWKCLDELWQHESGWDHTANNPSSGATGIPQLLPSAGHNIPPGYKSDPSIQIKWGMNYVGDRYGTPCKAWEHWQNPTNSPAGASTHWY